MKNSTSAIMLWVTARHRYTKDTAWDNDLQAVCVRREKKVMFRFGSQAQYLIYLFK